MHSSYIRNCTNNLSNPCGISPENNCISGVQDITSQDYVPGEEAIGQNVNINGKPEGISQRSRMPIIVKATPVLQIHPEVLHYNPFFGRLVNIQEKLEQLMQETYPPGTPQYSECKATEQQAISILKDRFGSHTWLL